MRRESRSLALCLLFSPGGFSSRLLCSCSPGALSLVGKLLSFPFGESSVYLGWQRCCRKPVLHLFLLSVRRRERRDFSTKLCRFPCQPRSWVPGRPRSSRESLSCPPAPRTSRGVRLPPPATDRGSVLLFMARRSSLLPLPLAPHPRASDLQFWDLFPGSSTHLKIRVDPLFCVWE